MDLAADVLVMTMILMIRQLSKSCCFCNRMDIDAGHIKIAKIVKWTFFYYNFFQKLKNFTIWNFIINLIWNCYKVSLDDST